MSDSPYSNPAPGNGLPPQTPPTFGTPPPIPIGEVHTLTRFPVIGLILLHYFTCGIFSLIWLNLMHGRLPRLRSDDPSAGKAVGFCFIPFFNLYWIFFTARRLCLRVDEQRVRYGLAPSNHTGLATAACIVQVIPYVNVLLGYTIMLPIYIGMMQASVNELVTKSETTTPLPAPAPLPAASGMPGWAIALIVCGCMIPMIAIMAALLLPALATAKQKTQRIQCVSCMKQVGLAMRIWEGDHGDQFPFNVSQSGGGTLELCAPGMDGLDKHSWQHFQVVSNELNDPKILHCPADYSSQPAADFAHLQAENVTYQICTGTNVNETHLGMVLAICPIHHNVLMADGSVQMVSEAVMRRLISETEEHQ